MNIAFVCWRPYQVLNVVNMVKNNVLGEKNTYDIYIQDLPSLLSISDNLVASSLFHNVYIFEEKTQGESFGARVRRIYNYIFCRQALVNDDLSNIKHSYSNYDIVVGSGWASYFVEMVNANPHARIIMYEDGAVTYYGDERQYMRESHAIPYKIMAKILRKGPFSVDVECIYVNNKEMVENKFSYPVLQLPKMNEETLKLQKQIFNYKESKIYTSKRIIYLSFTKTTSSVAEYDDEKMYNALHEYKNDCIIRPHPKWPIESDEFDIDNSGAMWELVIPDLNNCILISEFSTAMITPQMLYGRNFTLVFLYRMMCNSKRIISERDKLVNTFRKNNSNIYTPETFEEYLSLISTLLR